MLQKGVEPSMNKAVTLLAEGDPSVWMVAGLGIAVVFMGLVSIVGLVFVMNKLCERFLNKKPVNAPAPVTPAAPVASAPIANREEIVAAVCAAVAEEEGVDISALRVVSFKKL